MRFKKLSTLAVVPLLALSLASCSSDSESPSGKDTTVSAGKTSKSATPSGKNSSSASSDSASPSGDQGTTPPATSSADPQVGNSGKPSKEAVTSGLKEIVATSPQLRQLNLPPEVGDKLATCLVDKIYDRVTPETLNSIAKGGTDFSLSGADSELITSSTKECMTQLMQNVPNGNQ